VCESAITILDFMNRCTINLGIFIISFRSSLNDREITTFKSTLRSKTIYDLNFEICASSKRL
jgi:hypothetical protein